MLVTSCWLPYIVITLFSLHLPSPSVPSLFFVFLHFSLFLHTLLTFERDLCLRFLSTLVELSYLPSPRENKNFQFVKPTYSKLATDSDSGCFPFVQAGDSYMYFNTWMMQCTHCKEVSIAGHVGRPSIADDFCPLQCFFTTEYIPFYTLLASQVYVVINKQPK